MIQQRSSYSVFYGKPVEQLWLEQGGPFFEVEHPAFLLPTTASPTLQGALKDGLGEAVVAHVCPNFASLRAVDGMLISKY